MSFDAIETTAVVLFVVAAASIFAWILTQNRVPEAFAGAILSAATAPFLIPLAAVLALVTFVSALTMWLPALIYR